MMDNEDKLREKIKQVTQSRKNHEAEASRANAMCRRLEGDLEACKQQLAARDKTLSILQAALDKEKETTRDLTRQAQLDKVTLQQTLNENAALMQAQRKIEQAGENARRNASHAEQKERQLREENEQIRRENTAYREKNKELQAMLDRVQRGTQAG